MQVMKQCWFSESNQNCHNKMCHNSFAAKMVREQSLFQHVQTPKPSIQKEAPDWRFPKEHRVDSSSAGYSSNNYYKLANWPGYINVDNKQKTNQPSLNAVCIIKEMEDGTQPHINLQNTVLILWKYLLGKWRYIAQKHISPEV